MLTLEEVQAAAPANMKRLVTQKMVDDINSASSDPEMSRVIGENYVTYLGVMKEGRFKVEDYLSAVIYASFKLMNDSNKEAWCKTFPDRYAALKARGADEREVSAHVASYSKGKLVNAVLEQTMVPTWVLNAPLFQQALNVQAELMQTASSEKVRSDAANSILTHLKRPEAVKGQIDLNIQDSSGMNELRDLLGDIAARQQQAIRSGTPIKAITDQKIIEGEYEEIPIQQEETSKIPVPNKKRESIFK